MFVTLTEEIKFMILIYSSGLAFVKFSWWHRESKTITEFMRLYARELNGKRWRDVTIPYYSIVGNKEVSVFLVL